MKKKITLRKGQQWAEIGITLEGGRFSMSGLYGTVISYKQALKDAKDYWISFFEDQPEEMEDMHSRFDCIRKPNICANKVLEIDGELHGLDVHFEDGKEVWICEGAGQCIDTIAEMFPLKYGMPKLVRFWKSWHLNDFHAGCEHQRQLGWEKDGYDKHPSEPCPTCGYKFGTEWKREELPYNIENSINEAIGELRRSGVVVNE